MKFTLSCESVTLLSIENIEINSICLIQGQQTNKNGMPNYMSGSRQKLKRVLFFYNQHQNICLRGYHPSCLHTVPLK